MGDLSARLDYTLKPNSASFRSLETNSSPTNKEGTPEIKGNNISFRITVICIGFGILKRKTAEIGASVPFIHPLLFNKIDMYDNTHLELSSWRER